MADISVNTDSYPKPPAAPAQKSLLDTVGQFQDIESKGISISAQKLKLVNDQFGLMNQELATLANDPSITKEQAEKRLKTFADTHKFPSIVSNHMLEELKASPDVPTFAKNAALRGQSNIDKLNLTYGTPGSVNNGQATTPSMTSPLINGGAPRPVGPPIQNQLPVGTEQTDTRRTLPDGSANPNFGQKILSGPQAPQIPEGAAPVQGGFPGQYKLPSYIARPVPTTSIKPPAGDTGTTIFSPAGPSVALPPGSAEAATQAGAASGQVLAAARTRAANFQRDIFPLAQAIPALEKLGTKGSGPGTETFNHIRSFILSNVPGTTEKTFDDKVKTFDEAKKYLTDFVNQTGNSGTNDKLAAAFAGNPSVGISNAAAADVAKSAMALRRMQQTRDLSFEDSGLQPDQASKFFANGEIKYKSSDGKDKSIRINQLDPRAFGVDLMSTKAKATLKEQLNKNPRERELFEKSAELAILHGYLTPASK